MFCPNCGAYLNDGARFCSKCGSDLNKGECGCNTKERDPRWDVLKDYFGE